MTFTEIGPVELKGCPWDASAPQRPPQRLIGSLRRPVPPLRAGYGWSPPQRSGSAGSRPQAGDTMDVRGRHLLDLCVPTLGHEALPPPAEWLGPRCPPGTTTGSTAAPGGPEGPRPGHSRVAGSPPSPWPLRGRRRRQTPRGNSSDPATGPPPSLPSGLVNGTGRIAAGTRLPAKGPSDSRAAGCSPPSSGIHPLTNTSACTDQPAALDMTAPP